MKINFLFFVILLSIKMSLAQTNYVLNFNGSPDYVDLGNAAASNLRSVEFWFKPAVNITSAIAVPTMVLVGRNDATQLHEFGFTIHGNDYPVGTRGQMDFYISDNANYYYAYSNTSSWTAGTWYHIAGVIDPVSGMKIYVNGVLQASTAAYTIPIPAAPEITALGRWGDLAMRYFPGQIDEVRFWTKAITQGQILNKMCQDLTPANETGLKAYWKFNEGSGAQVFDLTTNAYHGSVTNCTWAAQNPCALSFNYGIAEGHIYDDVNSDCMQQAGDLPLSNWMVKADPGSNYGSVDSSGSYTLPLAPGTYTITHVVNSAMHLWDTVCPAPAYTHTAAITTGTTVSNLDFALHAKMYCPVLNVDVAGGAVRRCMSTNYYVQYSNAGNDTANNVVIKVTLDSLLNITSSSVPWDTLVGYTYTFNIGTLVPYQTGVFNFTAYVDCGATMGSTRCVKAEIGPIPTCTYPQDSTWDKSSVMVEGNCSDTLACFTITNTGDPGTGDMQGTSAYRIYENGLLVYTGTFQLTGGADTVICWPANGNTIQLQADQRPGHPGNSHPNAYVEDCGAATGGQPVLGIVNMMPPDDANYEVEIECIQVTGSFDPNDKAAIPAGVGVSHDISAGDELEYKIRFQNTGTDTAFTVVIRDTLSGFLDPATVVSGVSSHPYSFKLFGSGILEWTFSNILLPDSNVNEPGSHGFVKFKVKQMPGNPVGTVIENRVGIIFDFNDPVMTNTTFNTIWQQGLSVSQSQYLASGARVYPNPSDGYLFFEVDSKTEAWALRIMDAVGRTLYAQDVKGTNKTRADLSGYAKGVYFFRVTDANGMISAGKVMIQ